MRMSGASGRTGCVIGSGSDGQPQPERPGALLRIDVPGRARRALEEDVDVGAPTGKRRPGAERDGRFANLLASRSKRQRAPTYTSPQRQLRRGNARADGIEPDPIVP